jgi:hypothetical protein
MGDRLVTARYCERTHQTKLADRDERCPGCTSSGGCHGSELYTIRRHRKPAQPTRPAMTAQQAYAAAVAALDAMTAKFNRLGPELQAAGQRATVERYSRQIERTRADLRALADANSAERAAKYRKAVTYATANRVSYSEACTALGVAP